ncbi:formate dehydrogenase [Enemella dayhoffiae]|uniref:Formate dehydrogenase n=1 Tax=Enemella dayhoffiae TaxID=2016507 RepID=A0A255GYM7_9ACTN|nr:formate dehydrogenase [Enemella dayhoffiae]
MAESDCIVIQGSNMAECHPVGFQWVTEAKARGARVIHVDPRFTRTSAVSDRHIPIRVGSDIALLGGLINHVLSNELYFHEYVQHYTNGPTLVGEGFVDTEDLDGLFSGFDPELNAYDPASWAYAEGPETESGDDTDRIQGPAGGDTHGAELGEASHGESHGSGGPALDHASVLRDDSMTDPRCVLQLLKRHYRRYTPEMVAQVCGISVADFQYLAESVTSNSGRDRTTAFCYAVGWTQHTDGAQIIRTASILQLLLGNVGRPGGGVMALRGHASIQGSTDIPTLYNLLPGYLPMPRAGQEDFAAYLQTAGSKQEKGFWANADAYAVNLLKAWWGDAATEENEYGYQFLPRLTGAHGTYQTTLGMLDGQVDGYLVIGQNPAVGSANARLQRRALAALKWLVVRDLRLIETATFWSDGPEVENGEVAPADIGTEVFFLPAATHVEKAGSFTQTQRLLQWREKALDPPGEAMSDLQFAYLLGQRIRERVAGSTDPRDRGLQELTWDYRLDEQGEIDAESVLAEINGRHLTGEKAGQPLSSYLEMTADGSTSGGCWIYTGVYADGVNQANRRRPGREQDPIAPEWGWSWPANRRILYNRASADLDGKPWSERKKLIWWDEEQRRWVGRDVPDFPVDMAPDHRGSGVEGGPEALDGDDPFIMQADGKGWLYAPKGMVDGPMPTHYEGAESPVPNPLYGQQTNPAKKTFPRPDNQFVVGADAVAVYPYQFTTYRLTEHHTAGGMSRFLPYLSELQPEMFCEISPELAAERGLENGGWATLVSPRAAIETRVLVTERVSSLQVAGRTMHQIGLPYHWGVGARAVVEGDAANDLLGIVLDPNVQIQESKVGMCDIRPGRRPRGPALSALVADYQRRAGLQPETSPRKGKR